jgi:riboflavin biosynthesis pyrimidine reductase
MRRLFPVPEAHPEAHPDAADTPDAEHAEGTEPAENGEGAEGAENAENAAWPMTRLARAYAYPDIPTGGWLRANMVSSLDGAAHHDGRSQPLSGAADMRIFGVLRALADAVVVGAETVRQERYRPARPRAAFAARRAAAGQPPAPAIVVVSASLELDFGMPLFTEPVTPTVLLTGSMARADRRAAAEAAGVRVVVAGETSAVDPARIKPELARLGYTRLLTEGGPRLLGQLIAAGTLDEMCLALAPRLVVGQARRVTSGPQLPVPRELRLESVLEDAGFLFTRYRRP